MATVITNLLSAIPVFGQDIVELIWGGFSVSNATLNRFFSLHYLLPFVLAALVVAHLIAWRALYINICLFLYAGTFLKYYIWLYHTKD